MLTTLLHYITQLQLPNCHQRVDICRSKCAFYKLPLLGKITPQWAVRHGNTGFCFSLSDIPLHLFVFTLRLRSSMQDKLCWKKLLLSIK